MCWVINYNKNLTPGKSGGIIKAVIENFEKKKDNNLFLVS